MVIRLRRISLFIAVLAAAGCASPRKGVRLAPEAKLAVVPERSYAIDVATRPDSQVTQAIEKRVAELKARGGVCSSYGAVIESSYRSGQITIRPYMWRVGSLLASGEAKPNGEMTLAREIDSVNVGVRTVDDLLFTMEHEAAHIAFKIQNGVDASTDHANDYVRACRESAALSVSPGSH